MRSFRNALGLNLFLILATGALGACSSSNNTPSGTGGSSSGTGGAKSGAGGATSGTGGTTSGAGGSGAGGSGAGGSGTGGAKADASTDAPADAPATDTQVSDAGGFDYPTVDGPVSPANMTLTSNVLTNGAMFMSVNTCAGVNTSPQLTWTAGPSGTMSYAVVLSDTNNGAAHWVIWDIPSTVLMLPAGLPDGTTLTTPVMAQQLHKAQFFGAGGAYRGPCPAGATHTYVFEVTAVPTATLALGANPTTEQIRSQLEAVGIGHGDLSGTSNAVMAPVDAGPSDASGQ